MVGSTKSIDFGYWGRMKHIHDREETIRQIYRSELSCQLIGGMNIMCVERKSKWIKDWKKLLSFIRTMQNNSMF